MAKKRENAKVSPRKVCEKHFLDSDFLINRDDKTRGRIQKRGELQRRKLKPTAIPSVWPNLPSHLTKQPPMPRMTHGSAESRKSMESRRQKEILEAETFHSLNELTENFDLDRFGLFVSKNEHQITFFFSGCSK